DSGTVAAPIRGCVPARYYASRLRRMTDAALVTRRAWAGALVAVGVLVTAGLGVHYANTSHPGRVDVAIDRRLQHHPSDHQPTLVRIITIADPHNVAIACVVIGVLFFWRG